MIKFLFELYTMFCCLNIVLAMIYIGRLKNIARALEVKTETEKASKKERIKKYLLRIILTITPLLHVCTYLGLVRNLIKTDSELVIVEEDIEE